MVFYESQHKSEEKFQHCSKEKHQQNTMLGIWQVNFKMSEKVKKVSSVIFFFFPDIGN